MESTTINNDINAIKEVRVLFNELRSNLFRKETRELEKKIIEKEKFIIF